MTKPGATNVLIVLTIAAACFGLAVSQLDGTIVNVALPELARALHGTVTDLQWVVDAYTLMLAALLLSAGMVSDRFGARRAYLIGLAGFALTSAACGLAQTPVELIVARAAQGVTGALLVPPGLALLNNACAHDPKLRARAVAWWSQAGAACIALGPVVGGVVLHWMSWRAIFFVNLPLCAGGILVTLRLAEIPRVERGPMDIAGQLLAILAMIAMTGAVIELPRLGFGNAVVWGGFVTAAAAGVALIVVESRATNPVVPLAFFRQRSYVTAVGFGAMLNLTYFGMLFVLSLYLQRVLGYSPAEAGSAYLPLTATFIVSHAVSGRMTARIGPRLPMVLGAVIAAIGFLSLIQLDASSPYSHMVVPFLIIPGGLGLASPAMITSVLAGVDKARAGTAAAVLNTSRQIGGAAGVAIFGALVVGGTERIVPGLHTAIVVATVLLVLAAAAAWRGIPHKQGH
jgi:DHA2 family methylenomycin A resistance protein-like MFS transporter